MGCFCVKQPLQDRYTARDESSGQGGMESALPYRTIKASRAETESLTNVLQEQVAFHLSLQGHL